MAKITRSKRKELRAKGQLKPMSRQVEARKSAERQADEEAVAARVREARDEITHRRETDEDDEPPASGKQRRGATKRREGDSKPAGDKRSKRDWTLLILAGLTAVAGFIFWLTQRAPATEPAKKDPPASQAKAADTLTPPVTAPVPPVLVAPPPQPPSPPAVEAVAPPAPPPVAAPPTTAAPSAVATAAPKPALPPAVPVATAAPKPPPAADPKPPAAAPPAAAPKPKKPDNSDPYG